jgi:hypothetical protein
LHRVTVGERYEGEALERFCDRVDPDDRDAARDGDIRACHVGALRLPGPSQVMVTLSRMIADGSLGTDILVSLGRIMSGFVIGSALGVTLGLFFGTLR